MTDFVTRDGGLRTERWKVRCDDCGSEFTEVYPDGLDGDESFSATDDPKPCECDSQYTLLEELAS